MRFETYAKEHMWLIWEPSSKSNVVISRKILVMNLLNFQHGRDTKVKNLHERRDQFHGSIIREISEIQIIEAIASCLVDSEGFTLLNVENLQGRNENENPNVKW